MQCSTRVGLAPCLVIAVLAVVACSRSVDPPAPDVSAAGEFLTGEWLDSDLAVFRGIPYAEAPVGSLRWRPPAPHVPRTGPQNATQFGSACPQRQGNPEWYRRVARGFGRPPDVVPDLEAIDEDCLYLNVWAGIPDGTELQPVMVWIHGGGNRNGYAHEPNYLGHNLARRGVVVVSIQYRLGALGFMAHPALSAESERMNGRWGSGNYGALDQIAALEWVRENIEAFGGDPRRVTVFGESAGAGDIGTLLTSPLAENLFARAIMQSGGFQINSTQTLREEEAMGVTLMSALGIEEGAQSLQAMRALESQAIIEAVPKAVPSHYYDAIIDGWLLSRPSGSVLQRGEQHRADLLIGFTADEWYMYIPEAADEQRLTASLGRLVLEDDRSAARALLVTTQPPGLRTQIGRLESAGEFQCPSLEIARAMRRSSDGVFMYNFSRIRPGGENLLAYHGAEIPYVFDTADAWLPGDAADRRLTQMILAYWVQFAKTGDPNMDDLPHWPQFDPATEDHIDLGDEIRSAQGFERDLCAILDRHREAKLAAFDG